MKSGLRGSPVSLHKGLGGHRARAALWAPRQLQGSGRHDVPERGGVLYAAEEEVAAVVEHLAPYRGAPMLLPGMLQRAGSQVHIAELALPGLRLVDLDEPRELTARALCPSAVATRHRPVTQDQARALWDDPAAYDGVRWWSTLESSLLNLSLFDRRAKAWSVRAERPLSVGDPVVQQAAELLGLA